MYQSAGGKTKIHRSCGCTAGSNACRCDDRAAAVPQVVQRTLSSGGTPLDSETRDMMQTRFSSDFGKVRIHSDAASARSAVAVGARAYTYGNDIVFAAGQYQPRTAGGGRLLAHELTHVVQAQKSGLSTSAPPSGITRADDPSEREAESVAARFVSGELGRITAPSGHVQTVATAHLLQRADGDTSDPPKPEQLDDKPTTICGPNVTTQLRDAQLKTRSQFAGWKNSRKEKACQDLVSIVFGLVAWDIIQLNERDWIAKYRPPCASKASPSCTESVQVDDQCFYGGSVNYVHFGNMFDLCQGYYASAYPLNKQFTQNEMVGWIDFYKGAHLGGLMKASGNLQSAVDWAVAGFFNWPHAPTPRGDRTNCSPTCALPYSGGPFDVNWSGETF